MLQGSPYSTLFQPSSPAAQSGSGSRTSQQHCHRHWSQIQTGPKLDRVVHPGVYLTGFEVHEKLGKATLGSAKHLLRKLPGLRAVTTMLSSQKLEVSAVLDSYSRLLNSKMPRSHSMLKATLQGAHYYGGRLQAHVRQLSHPANCQRN